ncbi:MAG: cation transporting ATPase C-terminal domain-containing protein, partial [Bacillota bacterium]
QGLVITFGPLLTYMYALNHFSTLESRTIGFMTIAFVQLFHVFNVRRENGLGFDKTLLQNKYLWGAIVLTIGLQLLAVYTTFLQNIIHTVALQPTMWYLVLIGSLVPVAALQLYSYVKNYLL